MSRRTSRSRSRRGAPAGIDTRGPAPARGLSWAWTAALALAAAVTTAVAVAPALRPDSIVAAMMMSDFEALLDSSRGPSFDSVSRQYLASRNRHGQARAYMACKSLVRSYAELDPSGAPDSQMLHDVDEWAGLDQRNRLSRMIAAAMHDARRRHAGAKASARFAAMEASLDAAPATDICTSYDPIFFSLFRRAVEPHVHRPDVAAAIATYYYYSPYSNHAEWLQVLPRLADTWADLRDALKASGEVEAAGRCDRRIAALCLDVLTHERESGIQCLAADMLRRHVGEQSPAVDESMRSLLAAHTWNRGPAGNDLCAPMLSQPPLVKTAYEATVERFFMFACLVVLAWAGAAGFVLAIGTLLVPAARVMGAPDGVRFGRAVATGVVVYLIAPLLLCAWVADLYPGSGAPYYTAGGAMAVVHALVVVSVSLVILHALLLSHGVRHVVVRGGPAVALFLAAVVFLVLPARVTGPFLRSVHYSWPGLLWSFGVTVALIVVATLLARIPAARLARSAAVGWLVFAVTAAVSMTWHRRADRAYQAAVVDAYNDPMTARLGPDWETRYIEPAREAFEPPLK